MTDFKAYTRYDLLINKTILALDYGRVATGLALYTPGIHPFPILLERIIMTKVIEHNLSAIQEIIENESVDTLVFGLPKHADGKISTMTKEVEFFANKLMVKTNLPLFFQDETYSTEEARRRMTNSAQFNFKVDLKKIDSVAAQIILEDFIRNPDQLTKN